MSSAAPRLTRTSKMQLELIEPSVYPSGAVLYPCSVRLTDGNICECVYLVEPTAFNQLFRGLEPESMPNLLWVQAQEVALIQESPARLPARFANKIYHAGEHWGSHSFTLVFSWWCRSNYLVGEFVDFLKYPFGRQPSDVKDVLLYRQNKHATPVPRHYWCVFSR